MSKPTVSRIILWTTFLFLCLAPVLALAQTQPQPSEEGQVTLDFKEVELADLIQTISELTGENFLYDETVKGKVTIVSPESMTLDEAYMLFHTVLNVKGYTVVPSGEVNKIVPLKNAKESNLPTVLNGRGKMSEQVITRVFRLKYLDASIVGPTVLVPLMPSYANVAAYAPSNSLIITDTGSNIERLAKIIRELDQPDSEGLIEIVPLVNSSAEELAKILNEVMSQPASAPAKRRRSTQAGAANEPVTKIIPYPAGRSLILLASGDDMVIIKGLIAQMDQEMSGARSNINLFYLENADAVTLAATLNEILTGIKTEARTAQQGAPGSPLTAGPVTITADKPTNSLIINANPDDYRTIEEIIAKLDIKRKQVYVEALILELSMDATQRLGVSLQGAADVGDDSLIIGSSNQNTGPVGIGDALATGAAGIPSLLTQAVDGLLAGGFFNPITVTGPDGNEITVPSLSVLIDVSKTDSDVNLLSAPRLLTSDNEEAEIIVGSNVPIITGRLTDTGASDGLAQSVSVERQDVALILRFTPQITEGDLVRLNVYQEITDIAPATQALVASVGSPSDVGPTFTKRVLRNTVLVENNRTVVLGGLIDTNVIESVTKVPILGDIPFLGWLFKRTSTQEEKTNLLIFINPTIIKDAEDLERVTGRNRTAAKGFLTEKVINAVPENFFGEIDKEGNTTLPTGQPTESPETKGASQADRSAAEDAQGEASQ
ncbi:type II secretion system secretin GspD [Deltaproteobacteria bacterium IMCC39524]|nr:type II secretion system secretin GspD [Deltaproteobacteria bacterium IMCC39524]